MRVFTMEEQTIISKHMYNQITEADKRKIEFIMFKLSQCYIKGTLAALAGKKEETKVLETAIVRLSKQAEDISKLYPATQEDVDYALSNRQAS